MKPGSASGQPPSLTRTRSTVLLCGILALATVLRLFDLGHLSLWTDEGYSAWVARLPWPMFPGALAREANMPVYYVLLRLWLPIGHSEVAIRGLSVLFSVATIPVVYALGARLFDARVGMLGGLFVAVNAFHVEYAQEARSYSLVAFLVSVASLSFVACIERPSLRNWIGYLVATVLAVYSHVFAILVLAAHWTSLAFLRPRDIPWRPLLASTLLIGIFVLPVAVFAVRPDREHLSWAYKPGLGAVPRMISTLSGSGGYLPPDEKKALARPEIARRVLVLAYFVLLTVALIGAVRLWRAKRASVQAWHCGLIVSWAFVPILLAFGISLADPIFQPRYLIVSLPPLALLAALGLSSINRRWLLLVTLALVVGLAGREVYSYHTHAEKDDWRSATRYILSHAQPGDAVVFYAVGRGLFDYYRDLQTGPGVAAGPALFEYAMYSDDAVLFARNQFSFKPLQELRGRFRRIWLVRKDDWTLPTTPIGPVRVSLLGNAIQTTVEESHVLVDRADFSPGALHIRLYRAR